MKINHDMAEFLVEGGNILGGGGGGLKELGKKMAYIAVDLGTVNVIGIDELNNDDILVTASSVGAPAADGAYIEPSYQLKALELFKEINGKDIDGIIVNEMGALSIVNGWVISAATGIPIVDAPCNGRAHPTGVMGSIGLNRVVGYESIQTAVGGNPDNNNYIEVAIKGNLDRCSSMIRYASVMAGGMIFVLRNPVTVSYAKNNCAIGTMRQALQIGEIYIKNDGIKKIESVCEELNGKIVDRAKVVKKVLNTEGGFDSGYVELDSDSGRYKLYFWNEYMFLNKGNERIATFPDLIFTVDAIKWEVISSAEIKEGNEIYIAVIPKDSILLGSGVKDKELLKPIEDVTGEEVLKYLD
ncbi:MAG: DUF917 family protein [Thermoanaerobacteraceae bacterium]|nr:DUF917 family protein [Thermoanaerobacteraceae bacterium]